MSTTDKRKREFKKEPPADDEGGDHQAKKRRSRWGQEPEVADPAVVPAPAAPAPAPVPALSFDVASAAAATAAALEKAKKAALMQRQIQEQLANLNKLLDTQKKAPKARALRLDAQGREVDEQGNVIQIKATDVSTLKVNINKAKEQKMTEVLKQASKELQADVTKLPYYDPSVPTQKGERTRRGFQFVEEGTYIRKAEQVRRRQGLKGMEWGQRKQEERKDQQDEGRAALNPNLIELGPISRMAIKLKAHDSIPDVEWWDVPILKRTDADNGVAADARVPEILEEKINHLVEHPQPVNPVGEQPDPGAIPMFLTAKEKKKMTRLRKQEKTKEMQDRVRLGLVPPPPPKLRLSSMMKILGTQAVADPSKVEKQVRQQIEERQQAHLERNEARKQGKEQKKEKLKRKIEEQTAWETKVALFKVDDLSNRQHKFKVDINAQQHLFTGCAIISPNNGNLVVVEGSQRDIKQYKKLMLRRINWTNSAADEEGANESNETSAAKKGCYLVWEGSVKQRNFRNWKFVEARSELEAKKMLADRGVEYYWDMVKTYRDPDADM